jgi:hypothetical protein
VPVTENPCAFDFGGVSANAAAAAMKAPATTSVFFRLALSHTTMGPGRECPERQTKSGIQEITPGPAAGSGFSVT